MRKIKAVVALLLACMVTSSMAGCSSKADAGSTSSESSAQVSSQSETESEIPSEAPTESSSDATSAEDADVSESEGGDALTVEEYEARANGLLEEMVNLASLQSEAEAATDAESAKKVLEKLKAPFQDFAALKAPEKYTAAQEKFKSGCEAMVGYVDILIEMTSLDEEALTAEKQSEYTTKMTEYIQKAQADLTEGATLADAAENS